MNFPWIGSSRTALDGAIDHPNRVARRPCRTDSCLLPARRSPSLRKVPTSICLDTNVTRSIWFALLRLCSVGPDRCRLSVFCQRQRRLRRRRGRLSFSITQASVIARLCRIKLLHQDASKKKCDRVVKNPSDCQFNVRVGVGKPACASIGPRAIRYFSYFMVLL